MQSIGFGDKSGLISGVPENSTLHVPLDALACATATSRWLVVLLFSNSSYLSALNSYPQTGLYR